MSFRVSHGFLFMLAATVFSVAHPALAQGQPAPTAQQAAPEPVPAQIPPPDAAPQPLIVEEAAPPSAIAPVANEDLVPLPEVRELATPQAVPPRPSPVPGESSPAIPDAEKQQFDENLFFDAEQLVPEGEIAKKGAASKVNPRTSPGSALVISTTSHGKNSREAQLVAAERAMKLGRFESALEIYNSLYASNKRDPNILFGRASALQSVGRDEEAIAAYEDLLSVRPKNLEAQINMQGLIGKRYPAVALRALTDLYESNSGNVALVSQIAILEGRLGHHEEAIRFLGIAASMEPQNAGHLFNMAVIADRAGDKKAAVKYYEEALEADTLYGSGRSIPRESVYERLAELR